MKRNHTNDDASYDNTQHANAPSKRVKYTIKSQTMISILMCPDILFEIMQFVPDISFIYTFRSYGYISKEISQNIDKFSKSFILSTRTFPICNSKQDFNFVCENTSEIGSMKPEWFKERKKTGPTVEELRIDFYNPVLAFSF